MLLWCLWCGAHFEPPGDLVIRKASDLSRRWSEAVTSPLRAARRALKAPPAPDEAIETLREQVRKCELGAERIEQSALERLALDNLARSGDLGDAAARARKALAAYIRLTGAVKTEGFSVSLIEDLIRLNFPLSESDGDCVG